MTENLVNSVMPAVLHISESPTCVANSTQQDAELVRVAQEFEALFYNELFKVMRQTVPTDNEQGCGMSMFNALLDEELAKSVSSSGTLGISQALIRQFQGDNAQDLSFCVDKSDIEAS